MNVLITGAQGFVGKNLTQALNNLRDGKDRTRPALSIDEIYLYDLDSTAEEFYAVVDNGGKVKDVMVEHTLYGRISAELNISSRYDADQFVARAKETGATPLSQLTEGTHVHTLSVPDEATFARIVERLTALGILVEAV